MYSKRLPEGMLNPTNIIQSKCQSPWWEWGRQNLGSTQTTSCGTIQSPISWWPFVFWCQYETPLTALNLMCKCVWMRVKIIPLDIRTNSNPCLSQITPLMILYHFMDLPLLIIVYPDVKHIAFVGLVCWIHGISLGFSLPQSPVPKVTIEKWDGSSFAIVSRWVHLWSTENSMASCHVTRIVFTGQLTYEHIH